MKKLNRKGFTLIELLAVIVIMAIIVVVTVPTIINSISDARVSSIWNLAVSSANSYDTMAANDMIASDKTVSSDKINMTVSSTWACISTELAAILDLSSNDVKLVTDDTGDTDPTVPTYGADDKIVIGANTCSAIRLKSNGAAEVLLVAEAGGKFNVAGKVVYGLSSLDNGVQQ